MSPPPPVEGNAERCWEGETPPDRLVKTPPDRLACCHTPVCTGACAGGSLFVFFRFVRRNFSYSSARRDFGPEVCRSSTERQPYIVVSVVFVLLGISTTGVRPPKRDVHRAMQGPTNVPLRRRNAPSCSLFSLARQIILTAAGKTPKPDVQHHAASADERPICQSATKRYFFSLFCCIVVRYVNHLNHSSTKCFFTYLMYLVLSVSRQICQPCFATSSAKR